ncbi:MAG: Toluene efflux pump periplasmic linker protein TtgD [Porticoccaceae bacterium UBA1117]|nr:MAG: Toluene efflux pump periplasmic linker protein TtgD [Porticoccaceae bacterium UBA1117]
MNNNNVRFALIFAMALVLWFGSGLFKSSKATVPEGEAAIDYTHVQVVSFSEQMFRPTVSLQARTKANRSVDLLAQVSGKISSILAVEGSRVEKGQGICQIDSEDRLLRLAQAKASLENASIAYRGALKLKSVGYQSELAISLAKAVLATAKTDLRRAQLNVENLKIKAPFDGIVEFRPVEIGDFIMPGQLCATVVELSPLKIEALATELDVNTLALDDEAAVVIAGQAYSDAKISYLAHQANPSTRGYRVEALMSNPGQVIRAGVTAQLNVQIEARAAQLIPASSILLSDRGSTIVRVLGADQTVFSAEVTVVGETSEGVWVVGLPKEVVLVTVGQNYIIDGERVLPSFPVSNQE